MSYDEIIGSIGVGLTLIAYFANIFLLIPKDGKLFFLLNILGSGLTCYASLLIKYWPFVILEGVWCLVSVIGFFRTKKNYTGQCS
jgi:hypothetical protein